MRRLGLLPLCLLGACATATEPTVRESSGRDRLYGERYSATLWLSDKFQGEHTRRFDEQTLTLDMVQTAKGGGLDTSVAYQAPQELSVDDVHPDHFVCWSYDVDLEGGKWWAGPKISVNWIDQPVPSDGMSGWYENYVVETASQTPERIERDLMAWYDTVFIGETVQDGSTYRHLRVLFEQWTQFWAIRQDMRDEGATTIGPILAKWREGGLPDKAYDGAKINIETYDPTAGQVRIAGYIPPDASVAPERPPAPACWEWRD